MEVGFVKSSIRTDGICMQKGTGVILRSKCCANCEILEFGKSK